MTVALRCADSSQGATWTRTISRPAATSDRSSLPYWATKKPPPVLRREVTGIVVGEAVAVAVLDELDPAPELGHEQTAKLVEGEGGGLVEPSGELVGEEAGWKGEAVVGPQGPTG